MAGIHRRKRRLGKARLFWSDRFVQGRSMVAIPVAASLFN
jgi:hypothetical protein